jgi:hypothetical protein
MIFGGRWNRGRRLAGCALLVFLALCAGPAGPAAADARGPAPIGAVRLSQPSGSVDATPIATEAAASAPCPEGYGRNALLRVGRPGGPYSNLAKPLSGGGYDRAAPAARPNRSFATALDGRRPAAGEWWVVFECHSENEGVHPARFVTSITVSAGTWSLTGTGAGNFAVAWWLAGVAAAGAVGVVAYVRRRPHRTVARRR